MYYICIVNEYNITDLTDYVSKAKGNLRDRKCCKTL